MTEQPTKPGGVNGAQAGVSGSPRAATPVYTQSLPPPTRVTVVDFDMSFTHLVGFFVKAAFAAIPAAIIIAFIVAIIVGVFGGIGASLHR